MTPEPTTSVLERLFFAFLGGLTGAGYGVVLWAGLYLVTEHSHPNVVGWSAAIFACCGFFYGNFAFEALLSLFHFLWGFAYGVTESEIPSEQNRINGHLRAFLLVGFCIGIVLAIWAY